MKHAVKVEHFKPMTRNGQALYLLLDARLVGVVNYFNEKMFFLLVFHKAMALPWLVYLYYVI